MFLLGLSPAVTHPVPDTTASSAFLEDTDVETLFP